MPCRQAEPRPPGGTVSYVGALSYKDLSMMANFAFDALKSLEYSSMVIGMDGNLAGDVITRVEFSGIRQSKEAKQNFVTRQISKIPVKFNLNIHAPFYSLISSMNPQPPPGACALGECWGLQRVQHSFAGSAEKAAAPSSFRRRRLCQQRRVWAAGCCLFCCHICWLLLPCRGPGLRCVAPRPHTRLLLGVHSPAAC
jgi:hypothetical protein